MHATLADCAAVATQTWNNASGTKEFGNLIQLPFPAKAYGLVFATASMAGDTDTILYSDPLGTPVAEKTVLIDANTIGASASAFFKMFASPFSLVANTPIPTASASQGWAVSFDDSFLARAAAQRQSRAPWGWA